MLITIIAGARPNFMKISPIIRAVREAKSRGYDLDFRLVHTGQHFDKKMSADIFEELNIPAPDVNLACGGGTQAEQTAAIMVKFEKEILDHTPGLVLVVGDVTSTMACTIVAKKLCIDVAHVEAGIRSGDRTMPEEINRIVTDAICDYYFTTTQLAGKNLQEAGVNGNNIFFVGNTMIDSLLQHLDQLKKPALWDEQQLKEKEFFLLTLHRPSNVDDADQLQQIIRAIEGASGDMKVVFPVHPRTFKKLEQLSSFDERLIMTQPLSYLEFIFLLKSAKAVITDSGGITEEATVLGIPCITLRKTTERPETVEEGTNELIGDDLGRLSTCIQSVIDNRWKKGGIPDRWDGRAAERIIESLIKIYSVKKIK